MDKELQIQDVAEERRELDKKRPLHKEKIETANRSTLNEYAKFYAYIGTVSGGAIALSVSYIDKIDDLNRVVILCFLTNIHTLWLAWIFFAITIALVLLFSKRHLDAMYWDTMSDYADFEARDKKNKLALHELGMLVMRDGTLEEDKKSTTNNLQFFEKQKELASQKRKSAEKINQALPSYINVTFRLGIIFLVVFAISTSW